MVIYERHRPESTVLYQSVARAWQKFEIDYAGLNESTRCPEGADFASYLS